MTVLDKFYELKDSAYRKFEEYIKEGKSESESIELIRSDINVMFAFIKDNQKELQEEFAKDFHEMLNRKEIDPMLIMVMTMMFDGGGWGNKEKS